MSSEANKALMRRFYDALWCKGLADAADELVAEHVRVHGLPPGWPNGRDGVKKLVRELRQAFPDMHETIEDLVAEENRVAGRFTMTGTHRGEFLGVAPTGVAIRFAGMDIVRIENGLIAEWWFNEDTLGMYRQLGLVPSNLY